MKRTILVADDESHVTHMVSVKLKRDGVEVITASNGQEAFEAACELKPDLIITDLRMPIMSGVELAARLKETPATADVPVIVLTAHGHLLTPEDYERTNIKAMIAKPFSPRRLYEMADEYLYEGSGGIPPVNESDADPEINRDSSAQAA